MTNHEFFDYYINGSVVVRKILDKNDVICVLYTSKNFDKKMSDLSWNMTNLTMMLLRK